MSGIVVTGGAGFIGRHVVAALNARNERVTVIDALSRHQSYDPPACVEFVCAPVEGEQAHRLVMRLKPKSIVHLAAQIDVGLSERDPVTDARTNVIGTVNLLDAAMRAGTDSFVFASSGGAIYGDGAALPTPESTTPAPRSPYGVSKLCGEAYLAWAARQSALRTVALRFGNVYGPGQGLGGEAGVITKFAQQMLAGTSPVLNGDGKQTRDFVHVDCVVRAVLEAIDSSAARGAYNIGSGEEVTIARLLELMQLATDFDGSIARGPRSEQEVTRSCLAVERAKGDLGWRAEVELKNGIAQLIGSLAGEASCAPLDVAQY